MSQKASVMSNWTKEEYDQWCKRKTAAAKVAATRRPWSERELALLRAAFADPSKAVDIQVLATALNRSFFSVALKASRMGFGNFKRPKRAEATAVRVEAFKRNFAALSPEEKSARTAHLSRMQGKTFLGKKHTAESKAKMSAASRENHAKIGHPRGMLGKHHSAETKKKLSELESGRKIPREQVLQMMRTKVERYGTLGHRYGASWKAQWVEIGGKRFYARSLWEANYGRYLDFLKTSGEVTDWEHEPETFWFDGLKRGCVSYLPDFKVTLWTGEIEYHEVKGWMDDRSKTKIKRMAKYHPNIKLVVVDSARYRAIARKAAHIVPGWENKCSGPGQGPS